MANNRPSAFRTSNVTMLGSGRGGIANPVGFGVTITLKGSDDAP